MAERYTVQIGDEIIEFEGPDGMSEQQIEALADKVLASAKPGQKFAPSQFEGEPLFELVGGSVGKPTAEDTSSLGSFARGLPEEATFNFGDEIAAFGNAAIPGLAELDNLFGYTTEDQVGPLSGGDFWDRYERNLEANSQQMAADEAFHPTANAAGNIAGVVGTLPRAAMSVASRLPQGVADIAARFPKLTATALGGVSGAVSGAGAGEEGTRAQSAALGGLGGAALGGAITGGMELAPAIATYAKIFFGRGSDKEAVDQIIKALARDGFDVTSPAGVKQLRDALQEYTGKPVSLADIGGATRARAGVGLRTPSATQQQAIDLVRQRQAGQGQRLAADVRANVAPRTDVHALDEDLVRQRAEAAGPLRERALFENIPEQPLLPPATIEEGPNAGLRRALGLSNDAPVPVEKAPIAPTGRQSRVIDPTRETDPERYQLAVELQNIARLPDAQRALQGALSRAESERALLASTGQDISHLPDLTPGANLDVRAFDYLKRYLDDEVNALYRRGQGSTFSAGEAAQVRELRDAIRERLRTLVPEYGDYLDQYAGSSEMIDALREGLDFSKLSPEQIAALQSRRSDAGQELYRVGAARSLLDDIMQTRDTGNAASRILNSDEARAQLGATGISPVNLSNLNRSVAQERTLNLLPQELAGSQTAQRAAAQADASAGADLHVPFNPGSSLGWLGMVGRTILDRTSTARNAAVNAEIMPRLIATDPLVIEQTIKELEKRGDYLAAAQARRRVSELRNSLLSGAIIGSPVSIQGE